MSDFTAFQFQESTIGTDNTLFSGADNGKIFELFVDDTNRIPFHIRTGQQAFGAPAERKRFHYIEFHGYGPLSGTLRVRIYIDGRYVCDGEAVTCETPNKIRRVNIPMAQCIGYTIDVEFAGDVPLRALEFAFSPLASTS